MNIFSVHNEDLSQNNMGSEYYDSKCWTYSNVTIPDNMGRDVFEYNYPTVIDISYKEGNDND